MCAPIAGVNSLMYSSAQSNSSLTVSLMESASCGVSACIMAICKGPGSASERINSIMRRIAARRVRGRARVVISDFSSLNRGLICIRDAPK